MPSQRPDCFQMSAGWITGIVISCPPIAFISSRMIALTLSRTRCPSGRYVDAGGELTHEAGAEHELVAQRFGVGGILPEGGNEGLRAAHGYFAPFFLLAPPTPGAYWRRATGFPATMCDSKMSRRSLSWTPQYQTLSGYTTIIGPCPHCEKQPALLIRTSSLRPAFAASPRRYFTNPSTSPWVGQVSPPVHTKTWTRY